MNMTVVFPPRPRQLFIFALVFLLSLPSDAFSLLPSTPQKLLAATVLYGSKRRGRLADVSLDDIDGATRVISKKQKQKRLNSNGMNSKKRSSNKVEISPLLTEWASSSDQDDNFNSGTTVTVAGEEEGENGSLSPDLLFTPFAEDKNTKKKTKKKTSKNRMIRQDVLRLTPDQSSQLETLISNLSDQLSTSNCNVSKLVTQIRSLVELGRTFGGKDEVLMPILKRITFAKPKMDDEEKCSSYRLAWVGSDDAICHVGTSLHKVPLARLQEIYLMLGYNGGAHNWELIEVIRILGPFPNVRNTLKGSLNLSKLQKREGGVRLDITYTSMIDGTGKEILSGKDENVKRVQLDVWFAHEKALVCTTPDGDGDGNVLRGSGEKILLFVKEENLDGELEKLRAT